ncbi:MAG: hypothetical protein R3E09_16795 [Novosphingobium sp.]
MPSGLRYSVALAAAFLVAPVSANAQNTIATSKIDSRSLEIARKIIDEMFPPERREQMIFEMATSLGVQSATPRIKDIEDEGAQKIVADHLTGMMERMRPILRAHIPKMLDAMAYAYVDTFTYSELEAIYAFAQSEAGKTYFSRSPSLVSHPTVVDTNKSLFEASKRFSEAEQQELIKKLQIYFEKKAQTGS